MTSLEKLRELWFAVSNHGVSDTAIHALVSHAQDMEADRIAALIAQTLEDRARVREIDGDVIVDVLRKEIEARSYRPKFGG
jgi:hypothetical protein